MRVLAFLSLLLALPMTTLAESIDLSANDDAVRLGFGWTVRDDRLALDASWLHSQDHGDVIGLTASVFGLATGTEGPVRAGIGGKLVYTDPDRINENGFALAPGGFFSYDFPEFNRFTLYGHLYFAPSVLGFGDTEQYRDTEVRLIYKVIEDADLFIGVRNVHVDYDINHTDFDTGLNLGLTIRF